MNKYKYFWILQGNYTYGNQWEDLCCYDKSKYSYSEVMKDLHDYRNNEKASFRVINRRELNRSEK